MKRTGLLHLYYGDGKGKTTAAMGLALRAMGSGKQVVILQIHKGGKALEHVVALLQLFQIDVAVVVGKGLPVAPHLRAPQLAQGVTM